MYRHDIQCGVMVERKRLRWQAGGFNHLAALGSVGVREVRWMKNCDYPYLPYYHFPLPSARVPRIPFPHLTDFHSYESMFACFKFFVFHSHTLIPSSNLIVRFSITPGCSSSSACSSSKEMVPLLSTSASSNSARVSSSSLSSLNWSMLSSMHDFRTVRSSLKSMYPLPEECGMEVWNHRNTTWEDEIIKYRKCMRMGLWEWKYGYVNGMGIQKSS